MLLRAALSTLVLCAMAHAQERQLTFTPKNHCLDNNDNFSADGRYLCYDTRETVGPGIENGQTIEMVEIATGEETVLYAASNPIIGIEAAPGIGAASFSFEGMSVIFIHGPPVSTVPQRGYYGKPNRNGARVTADPSHEFTWLDHRDVATDRDTLPGAHRGGTHRHEFARHGKRIGFTYDDFLLPEYDRSVGYMEAHPDAPGEATHWFALLVPVVRKDAAKPGVIEKAYADSWITPDGTMRGFIGKVRNDDGRTYEESLFALDVPLDVDISTADAGSATRFPSPPEGVSIRRLTHTWAGGILRGDAAGKRIAYYAKDPNDTIQLFVIDAEGSDRHVNPAKRPKQVTAFENDAGPGLRWHPNGEYLACIADNAVAVTHIESGETRYLSSRGGELERLNLVWSHDGHTLAYNKIVPHESGKTTYDGSGFMQVFLVDFAPWR